MSNPNTLVTTRNAPEDEAYREGVLDDITNPGTVVHKTHGGYRALTRNGRTIGIRHSGMGATVSFTIQEPYKVFYEFWLNRSSVVDLLARIGVVM